MLNKVDFKQTAKQYMRWRIAREKMGVHRIVDQVTDTSLELMTLTELLAPPPGVGQIPPAATQPAATEPSSSPPPSSPGLVPTTQPAGEGR